MKKNQNNSLSEVMQEIFTSVKKYGNSCKVVDETILLKINGENLLIYQTDDGMINLQKEGDETPFYVYDNVAVTHWRIYFLLENMKDSIPLSNFIYDLYDKLNESELVDEYDDGTKVKIVNVNQFAFILNGEEIIVVEEYFENNTKLRFSTPTRDFEYDAYVLKTTDILMRFYAEYTLYKHLKK